MTGPDSRRDAGPAVVARRVLGPRLVEYGIDSAVLRRESRLRVLLPSGYTEAGATFPVLYLLHGGGDDYRAWTDKGEATEATEGLPLIVVMPDGGRGSFYSDWTGPDRHGRPPAWERFHLTELLPWVDRTFRTDARREGRALAGLSMGGFGAMSYAARHPDMFVAAASFSGALDNSMYRFIFTTATRRDGGEKTAIWGDRKTNVLRWRAHNPVDLAANLCATTLVVRTGTGLPGELVPDARPDPIEAIVFHESLRMHHTLRRLGIEHEWSVRRGGHDWPYWARNLRDTLPSLHKTFNDPPPLPREWRHTSADVSFAVDGWQVTRSEPITGFATLQIIHNGFSLTGHGLATVTTPPRYRPGARYRLTVAARTSIRHADDSGRLTVPLRLDPSGPPATVTIDEDTS